MEEAQAMQYHALLAKARVDTKGIEHQPQSLASPKAHRGEGYTPRHRMELVEIFRYLRKNTDIKVNAANFHRFVNIPVSRTSITQWDRSFDRIKFDVDHGRGNKCMLSSSPIDLIRDLLDKTVQEWLLEVRKSNGIASGLQL
jgi:hypothetical protein